MVLKNCIEMKMRPGRRDTIFASKSKNPITMNKQNENEKVKVWICSVCGYSHEGPEPPKECPVCGVAREYFDEVIP